jgi:hypothetical protein
VKVRALIDTPDGKPAGTIYELHDDAAHVLITVGNVEPYPDPEPAPRRRPYARKDLVAAD